MKIRSIGRTSAAIALGAVLANLVAIPATAQIELETQVGLFVPTSSLISGRVPDFGSSLETEWKHEVAASFGGGITVWLTPGFGIGGRASYSPSSVEISFRFDPDQPPGDVEDAWTARATARAIVRAFSTETAEYFVSGGVGVVTRGGEAFERAEGVTDPTLSLGAAARVALSRRLGLRIEIEDYLYVVDLVTPRSPEESRLQNDLVFSLTLDFRP